MPVLCEFTGNPLSLPTFWVIVNQTSSYGWREPDMSHGIRAACEDSMDFNLTKFDIFVVGLDKGRISCTSHMAGIEMASFVTF